MAICTGLIGYGYWGKIVVKYLDENTDINLKRIFSLDAEREGLFTNELQDIWADDEIQAVFVVTPIETHFELVKKSLECGKHVFCEKPVTMKGAQARELRDLAQVKSLKLVVDLTYTFSSALELAKYYLGQGRIGALQYIELALKKIGNHSAGDIRSVLGPHLVSMLGMFYPLENLKFDCHTYISVEGKAESCSVTFTDGNFSGRMDLSANYPEKCREVVLYGDKGTIIYRPGGTEWTLRLLQYSAATRTSTRMLSQDVVDIRTDEGNNVRWAIKFFTQVLSGHKASNIAEAVKVTDILEQLVKA